MSLTTGLQGWGSDTGDEEKQDTPGTAKGMLRYTGQAIASQKQMRRRL